MKKNLLIGAITNYAWEYVAPFFKSYQRAGFENCDCVMFVANMSESTIEKIKSCGVTVLQIPDNIKNERIINSRWKIYEDFIKANPEKYNLVFTADVRDVFFQRDVFKLYENYRSFLGIAIEDGDISDDPKYNKKWIIDAYGEDIYNMIAHERIFCVGTVWGTADKFCEFASIMWDKLGSDWARRKNVIEQGVSNYLIYHDKMFADSLIKSDNQSGYVMTIGLTKRENIKLDSNNNILNGKGEIAAVVHQYDRKIDIVWKVINKFCPECKLYYKAVILRYPGLFWRVMRYYYCCVCKKGLFKALYITIRRRLPGGKNFG